MTLIKAFLVALIGSVVVNSILVLAIRPMVDNPALPSLSVGPVAFLTAIGAIGATIVYAIMRNMMVRPNKAFIWVSVIVLLLSLIPDYLIIGQTTGHFAGATTQDALALMFMHVVAAVIIVWALAKLWGGKGMKPVMAATSTR
jgi:hypothetical protein